MNDVPEDDEKPLDPAAARVVARVRALMLVSGATTLIAVAAVVGVIGYRIFHSGGSITPSEVTALLPKGARIVSTAAAGDRIAVTIEVGGALEVRLFDAHTLKDAGRLRFATEP
jgi:hypothetical protein